MSRQERPKLVHHLAQVVLPQVDALNPRLAHLRAVVLAGVQHGQAHALGLGGHEGAQLDELRAGADDDGDVHGLSSTWWKVTPVFCVNPSSFVRGEASVAKRNIRSIESA